MTTNCEFRNYQVFLCKFSLDSFASYLKVFHSIADEPLSESDNVEHASVLLL